MSSSVRGSWVQRKRWSRKETRALDNIAFLSMGHDPETNVVNPWGFSHESPNLGILGASVMGTSGARNPTLTSQARAWRSAAHLVENWEDASS